MNVIILIFETILYENDSPNRSKSELLGVPEEEDFKKYKINTYEYCWREK